jgi:predicted deacylase
MTISLRKFEFEGEPGGPRLLITGGVHGDEFEPIASIRRLIDLFRTDADEVSGFQGHVTFVPIVNEAAFLRGHRCAEDDLDLARTCPGKSDGSITEQTAAALSELIRSADFYIDLHTGGTEYSVTPLAGYSLHHDPAILDVQRRMAKAFNLPVVWGTAGDLDGRSLSVARDAGVPAIYCEYSGSATCSASGVEGYVEGCLNVMSELGMRDHPVSFGRVGHVIEDPTPGSGHMEVCNPSPVTGFFEPAVEVGDVVADGQLLGTVYDLKEFSPFEMRSPHGGIVITLRTFPRVREGESVGVVAEI